MDYLVKWGCELGLVRLCVSTRVCVYAWLCVILEPFAGACSLGTMVQPGALAPQRGLLLTTSHHRWRRSLTKALPRFRDHRAFLDVSDIIYDFNDQALFMKQWVENNSSHEVLCKRLKLFKSLDAYLRVDLWTEPPKLQPESFGSVSSGKRNEEFCHMSQISSGGPRWLFVLFCQ